MPTKTDSNIILQNHVFQHMIFRIAWVVKCDAHMESCVLTYYLDEKK